MKSKLFLLMLGALGLPGCATVHPGQMANLSQNTGPLPLDVSMKSIDPDTDDAFQLVEVTFENTSDQWVRIAKTEALLGDPVKTRMSVVVGNDLAAWAEAVAAKEKVEQYNRELLQSTLLVAGAAAAVAGSATDNDTVALSGLSVVAGTSLWAAADVINAKLKRANSPKHVPESHLYSPTIVPPKLFVRRWVLLNKKPGTRVTSLAFRVETTDAVKATYAAWLVPEDER
jgi:hypothetical protein